jgi:methylated-DNA-[protein]-cysteine S-methyltransferase
MGNFKEKVLKIVSQIPKGKVLTYQEMAEKAGNAKAARAAGNILHKNKDPKVFCHRVVRSDGKVGGYNLGTEKKIRILKKEGIKITNQKIVKDGKR